MRYTAAAAAVILALTVASYIAGLIATILHHT